MDSTFISFECEQQQQVLQDLSLVAPHFLDHTFENMSLHNESSSNHVTILSELLRDNKALSSRSRFISDDTMFGNTRDIPDKSIDLNNSEVEESKDQKINCSQPT